jgi:hypothetical protein
MKGSSMSVSIERRINAGVVACPTPTIRRTPSAEQKNSKTRNAENATERLSENC